MGRFRNSGLVALAAVALAAPSWGQGSPVQRGSIQLAGGASISHTRSIETGATTNQFGINPKVGYFIARGVALSANALVARISSAGGHSTNWGIGPGLAYYFRTGSSAVLPFLSGQVLLSEQRSPGSATASPDLKTSQRSWDVSGGALFMVGSHIGITGELYFRRDRVSFRSAGITELISRTEDYGLRWGVAGFVF